MQELFENSFLNSQYPNGAMSLDRVSVSGPQSSAGILGISANTNLGGIKFNARGVVIFAAIFVIVVKIIDVMLSGGLAG